MYTYHVACGTSATAPAQQGPRDIRWICHTTIIDGPRSRCRAMVMNDGALKIVGVINLLLYYHQGCSLGYVSL